MKRFTSMKMLLLKWCVAVLLFASFVAGEIKNKGWWKNAVFYQVYPRSFIDSNNDGIGDLKGIINKLQHFKDSNITAIWLSPIYASPMVDFGYDISDFRAIDPTYGTMEDFENLTKKAKELGIKVIMDLVPNHTSDKHDWFKQSVDSEGKYKDYYMWNEGKKEGNNTLAPNNWISVFSGSAWTYNGIRNEWYFHQFEYRQPDLNYTNPNVRNEMEEIIRFWLGKGVDGFRIDAVPHIYEKDGLPDEPISNDQNAKEGDYNYLNHIYTKDDPRTYDLIQSWRNVLDKWADDHNEDEKVILTEAYTNLDNTTKFYKYGSHVPFNFNFIMQINKNSKPADFKKLIDDWVERVPEGQSANWVIGNHDRSRSATRFPGRADQMTMLTMVLPGIAVTYYGEEIGMEDKSDISWEDTKDPQACLAGNETYKEHSRDPARTPFQWDNSTNAGFNNATKPWIPVHENYKTLNLKKQKEDEISHYNLYQKLTSLKKGSETLKSGSLKTEIMNNDQVLAIVRQFTNGDVILLINFNDVETLDVDVTKLINDDRNLILYASNVESKLKWGSEYSPKSIKIPGKASVLLLRSNGVVLAISIQLIVGTALFSLFKSMF